MRGMGMRVGDAQHERKLNLDKEHKFIPNNQIWSAFLKHSTTGSGRNAVCGTQDRRATHSSSYPPFNLHPSNYLT